MDESATRSVIFKMTAEADKRAIPNLEKFGKSIERIQVKALDTVDKRRQASMDVLTRMSKASVDLERKAHKEISAMINARIALRQKELGLEGRSGAGTRSSPGTGKKVPAGAPRGDDLTKRLREEEKAREKAAKEFEKNLAREQKESEKASKEAAKRFQREINERIKLREREAKAADRLRQQQEREDARVHSRHRKRQQQRAAENRKAREKETQEAIRAAQQEAKAEEQIRKQQEKEADRLHKRHRQRQRSIALQNRKSRQAEAREAQQSLRATEQQMSQAVGRMSAANGLLVEGLTSSAESAVRIGTGLAQIGLVSEKNTEKLLRGVIALRSMNDVLSGSINLWHRSRKVAQGYHETLQAMRATQSAIAAQQALTPGRIGRGAASRAGGNLAAGAVGGAAGTAALTGLQKATLVVGNALGGIKSAASAAALPLAKVGAALGAVAFYGDVLGSLITTGSPKSRPGSTREKVEEEAGGALSSVSQFFLRRKTTEDLESRLADAKRLGGETERLEAELSRRRADKMEEAKNKRRKQEEQKREREKQEREKISTRIERRGMVAEIALQPSISRAENTRGAGQIQAIDAAQKAIRQQKAGIASLDTGGSAETRGTQLDELLKLDEQAVNLANQRKEAEKKILQTKKEQASTAIDASREELSNTKQTLEKTKERLKSIKDSLLSSDVRFALKSEKDRKKFLDAARKANAGGQLNRKEAELLLSDAVGKPRDVAEQQMVEAAEAAGLRQVQGADLRAEQRKLEAEVARQEKIVQRVQQKISVQREMKLSYEQSEEEIADAVVEEIQARDQRVLEILKNRVRVLEEQQEMTNRRRTANAAG